MCLSSSGGRRELVGVGTSTEEGIARVERARGLVRLQEDLDGRIGGT